MNVFTYVIAGTTFLDPKSNGKVSAVGVIYIAATNSLGAAIGVAAGLIAKPGDVFITHFKYKTLTSVMLNSPNNKVLSLVNLNIFKVRNKSLGSYKAK